MFTDIKRTEAFNQKQSQTETFGSTRESLLFVLMQWMF